MPAGLNWYELGVTIIPVRIGKQVSNGKSENNELYPFDWYSQNRLQQNFLSFLSRSGCSLNLLAYMNLQNCCVEKTLLGYLWGEMAMVEQCTVLAEMFFFSCPRLLGRGFVNPWLKSIDPFLNYVHVFHVQTVFNRIFFFRQVQFIASSK